MDSAPSGKQGISFVLRKVLFTEVSVEPFYDTRQLLCTEGREIKLSTEYCSLYSTYQKVVNISGEYLAISTTYVDGQLHEGEYGMKYNTVYVEQEGMHFCLCR